MDGMELYQLGCRFPQTVIPAGLQADLPLIRYEEAQGWLGEYWYFAPGKHVPGMYAKLHLPEGLPLEIRTLSGCPGADTAPAQPVQHSERALEYLNRCAGVIETSAPEEKEKAGLFGDWFTQLAPQRQLWYSLFRASPQMDKNHTATETAPPDWLLKTWTAEHLKQVSEAAPARNREPARLPTEKGKTLWQLGAELAEQAGVPGELVQGLPRLSFEDAAGWIIEFWYYYRDAGLAYWLFDKPNYYLRAVLSDRRLLELKNLTGETRFRKSWLDVWGVEWTCRKELEYLACCEQLLAREHPTREQVTAHQGLWLQAHPKEYVSWLAWQSGLGEEAGRWILAENRVPGKDFLQVLWAREMEKGIRLGTPETAEACLEMLVQHRREQTKEGG